MVSELHLAPEDFLEFSSNINSKETPHYPLLVRRGQRGDVEEWFIILQRRRKVDCIFLCENLACTIYPHRPHVCSLYPFELDGKEQKKGCLCPVKFVREPGTENVAKQLQADLHGHGKIARAWAIKFGNKAPDMKKFSEYFGD
jgi:Fe-S-cluster containining protein